MPSYFKVSQADAPWGDYGDILINGLAEPTHDHGRLKRLELSRTGPFVPPVSQPFGQIVIVDDLRRKLEATTFTGFEFIEVELTKVVRCDWHRWNQESHEPQRYPESGEPEDYIQKGSHDPSLLAELPKLWALAVESTKHLQVQGRSAFYLDRHPGTDIARETYIFWISEPLKSWLERYSGQWTLFSPVTPH